jgi:hypothetical protein
MRHQTDLSKPTQHAGLIGAASATTRKHERGSHAQTSRHWVRASAKASSLTRKRLACRAAATSAAYRGEWKCAVSRAETGVVIVEVDDAHACSPLLALQSADSNGDIRDGAETFGFVALRVMVAAAEVETDAAILSHRQGRGEGATGRVQERGAASRLPTGELRRDLRPLHALSPTSRSLMTGLGHMKRFDVRNGDEHFLIVAVVAQGHIVVVHLCQDADVRLHTGGGIEPNGFASSLPECRLHVVVSVVAR